MIKLVVSNQKGGAAKTTTTANLGRWFADHGLKVLLIDTDPQGNLGAMIGAKPGAESYLVHFVMYKRAFQDCITKVGNLDVLCSNRETTKTDAHLSDQVARELALEALFSKVDSGYDVILIDTPPSINIIQACAMVYAKRILLPVAMDTLSFQGAVAACETAKSLNAFFNRDIRPAAIMPVNVDKRMQMTEMIMNALGDLAKREGIPILHPIRTDSVVTKAIRARSLLTDYDSKAKATEDYAVAGAELLNLMKDYLDGRQLNFQVEAAI